MFQVRFLLIIFYLFFFVVFHFASCGYFVIFVILLLQSKFKVSSSWCFSSFTILKCLSDDIMIIL
jgi:hypothetical protein